MYKKNRFSDRNDRGSRGPRERRPGRMYPAVCASCQNDCEVPFKPFEGKPVLCRDCFKNDDRSFEGSNDRGNRFEREDRFERSDRFDRGNRFERDDRPAPKVRNNYHGTCNSCGADCEVPFRPEPGRALFCPACFGKGQNASGKTGNAAGANSGMTAEQYKTLNSKLDRILELFEMAMNTDLDESDDADFEDMEEMDDGMMEDASFEEEKPAPAKKAPKAKAEKPAKAAKAKKTSKKKA